MHASKRQWTLQLGKYGGPHEVTWAPGKLYGTIATIQTASFQELKEALSPKERVANATLIAAAPELLEALENLMLHHRVSRPQSDTLEDRRILARAAIAKATGNPPTMPGEVVVGSEEWDAQETARLAALKPDGDPIS